MTGTRRGPGKSRAARRRFAAHAAVSCAVLGFAACNTYTGDLLTSAAGASSVDGGASGSLATPGGAATAGGAPAAGGSLAVAGSGGRTSDQAGTAGIGEGGANDGGSGALSGSGGASAGTAGSVAGAGTGVGGSAGGSGGATTSSGGAAGSGVVAGAGGAVTTGGSTGGGGFESIDTFEQDTVGQTTLLKLPLSHGRNGPWYELDDATVGGTAKFAAASVTNALVASSTLGLHLTGTGFTGGFGVGFGADFVNSAGTKAVYNVSAYSGIRFYAKIGAATAQNTLMLLIPTTYSDPMGGKCNNTASATSANKCNDHLFCQFIGVTTTWASYECDFKDLMQQKFGLPQASLDPASVYSVQFTLANNKAVDFWLDDISFVVK